MATLDGATLVARCLKAQGVEFMFGVVGFPVIPIAAAAQKEGIRYIGCRNEQSASYAAGAVGYLTGRPGACLVVCGPGVVHGLAGMANAWSNAWPMILIGGAPDAFQDGMGSFQEAPHVETVRSYAKLARRPESLERLPYYAEQAVRTSIYGRPGAVYLDLPNDLIVGEVEEDAAPVLPRCPEPPRPQAGADEIAATLRVLREAQRPLVIVGKGAAYARAEDEVRRFIDATQLPFLPTPMGKGVVPDDHPLSIAPGRSHALQHADAILLLGARLNWILHFGKAPRFAKDVKILQLEIAAEEIGTNVTPEVALVGDARAIVGQLNDALDREPWSYPSETDWRVALGAAVDKNREQVLAMERDAGEPMGYYHVLAAIRDRAPRDAIFVNEGSNTMDIGRSVLRNQGPRERLDAGTFGTMGVGLGFALAAAAVHPDRKVVAVEGDSAFGFSGMEVETACRYRLPITFVIINNNGIGFGVDAIDPDNVPPFAYTPNARYDQIIEAFGGRGYFVTKSADLGPILAEAYADPGPTIVNVMINPRAQRKPQKFDWLTR